MRQKLEPSKHIAKQNNRAQFSRTYVFDEVRTPKGNGTKAIAEATMRTSIARIDFMV